MATKDTVVQELVVNTLTQAQFDTAKKAGTLSPYELYGTPDASVRLPVLTPMWFDHILNDVSWLRADTFSWQSGDVYVAAYEHLLSDFEGTAVETETIGDITIAFYRAEDEHKICLPDQESNISALYEATGVAWYYLLDTENKQFKLPRTKYGFVGMRDGVGNYVEAGLPNITASWNDRIAYYGGRNSSGAVSNGPGTGAEAGVKSVSYGSEYLFSAADSNPIYGNSDTVQPPATQMYLYFFVGNFTQDSVEQTAGITSETLNSKLDIGAGNATDETKATIVGWGMPDYTAGVDISTAVGNTFTMPVTALIYVNAGGSSKIAVYKDNSSGVRLAYLENTNNNTVTDHIIVEKGTVLYIAQRAGSYATLRYFPLKGANQ